MEKLSSKVNVPSNNLRLENGDDNTMTMELAIPQVHYNGGRFSVLNFYSFFLLFTAKGLCPSMSK